MWETLTVVKIRFFANLEIFMEKKELALTLDDSRQHTVADVVTEISRLEGKDLKGMVMEEQGRPRGSVRIVLNDRLLLKDALETEVRDGDRILVFPLLGGG
jgi:molybdopterin converting factor small subunit